MIIVIAGVMDYLENRDSEVALPRRFKPQGAASTAKTGCPGSSPKTKNSGYFTCLGTKQKRHSLNKEWRFL